MPVMGFLIGQSKHFSQFLSRVPLVNVQIVGCEIYRVTGGMAAETVVSLVQLHAGMPVRVEGAARHAVPPDPQAQRLRGHSGRDVLPDRFKYCHNSNSLLCVRFRCAALRCSAMILCPVPSMAWTFFHTMSVLCFSAESDFNSVFILPR